MYFRLWEFCFGGESNLLKHLGDHEIRQSQSREKQPTGSGPIGKFQGYETYKNGFSRNDGHKTQGGTPHRASGIGSHSDKLKLKVLCLRRPRLDSLSALDLLVVSDSLSLEALYEKLEPTERLLSRKISPPLYSFFEFNKKVLAKNPFLQKVLAGDHITLIGDKDVLTAAG